MLTGVSGSKCATPANNGSFTIAGVYDSADGEVVLVDNVATCTGPDSNIGIIAWKQAGTLLKLWTRDCIFEHLTFQVADGFTCGKLVDITKSPLADATDCSANIFRDCNFTGANRQRIASSEGLSIRHRITPLNVGRSRHLRRRLVAVPACIAGRERRGRVAPEAGGRAAQAQCSPANL